MTEKDRASKASRVGEYLGRCWKGYLRNLTRVSGWLRKVGVPRKLASFCALLLHTVTVMVLLYIAFWVTVVFIVALVGSCGLFSSEPEPASWRDGPEGPGIYENGVRTDCGRSFEDDQ
ncbi:DUF3742 family protein [Pseudomonas sp. S3_H04]